MEVNLNRFILLISDSQGGVFSFINSSEGPPRYSILRYTSDKKGKWKTIGNYSGKFYFYGVFVSGVKIAYNK